MFTFLKERILWNVKSIYTLLHVISFVSRNTLFLPSSVRSNGLTAGGIVASRGLSKYSTAAVQFDCLYPPAK